MARDTASPVMVESCHRLVEAFLGMAVYAVEHAGAGAWQDNWALAYRAVHYETDIDDMIESTRLILERHCTDEKVSNWWFWRKR